ncbi:MAG: hypothetical protein ABI354_00655 [Candidatus Saccharimonadales bacterium]
MSDQHKQHSEEIIKRIDADLGGLRDDIILSIEQAHVPAQQPVARQSRLRRPVYTNNPGHTP